MFEIPLPPPYPASYQGDLMLATFRLPLVVGNEFPHQALIIVLPSQLTEAAEVLTIGARADDKYWTSLSQHSMRTGKDALTDAWIDFQNVLAEVPGLPMKW